ncbi:hypothetical protein DL93DRAFT_2088002 [Clavulina sp. PMI_390]|nr:hypothetical protein DL93DRAFT_2088002 [Clavulina sp. PMI_390]
MGERGDTGEELESWEDDDDEDDGIDTNGSSLDQNVGKFDSPSSPIPLTSAAFLHIPPIESLYSRLPHTLTRLALVDMGGSASTLGLSNSSFPHTHEVQIPMRVLSQQLPRLTHLDLSYNWLDKSRMLNVAWGTQWREMKVVGFRGCRWWEAARGAVGSSNSDGDGKESGMEIGGKINVQRPGRWIDFVVE